MDTDPATPVAGRETRVHVFIQTPGGGGVPSLEVHHERLAHFLLASENLEDFHHLHPEDFGLLTDEALVEGRFSFPVTFRFGGRYTLVAEFTDGGRAVQKVFSLSVDGPAQGPTAWRFSRTREADEGLRGRLETVPVTLEAGRRAECHILVSRHGAPVTDLEPYLGVPAHLAIFREGATDPAHTHGGGEEFAHQHFHQPAPNYQGPKLYFGHRFGPPGRYRLFALFRCDGRVRTIPFDVEVVSPAEGGA